MYSRVIIKPISGSTARLLLQNLIEKGRFTTVLDCEVFIGKNGLGKEKEGDKKTPVGEFGILYAFGVKPNPGTTLNYLNIKDSHYACDDNGPFYNKIVDISVENHQCKGEHMVEYVPQYNYGIFLDYNKECVYPDGSAIFMHCKGERDYTDGCIGLSEKDMITMLKNVDSNTRIIIEE